MIIFFKRGIFEVTSSFQLGHFFKQGQFFQQENSKIVSYFWNCVIFSIWCQNSKCYWGFDAQIYTYTGS